LAKVFSGPGRLVRLLGLSVFLFAFAPAQAANGNYVFIGAEAGAGGPAYFGFEGSLGHQWNAFEARLEGRLRLGNVVAADGVAWVGWKPLADLSLRAGYDAWFLDASTTGRSFGGRADWRLPLGFGLAAAYDAAGNVWGLGGGLENDYLGLQLWARNTDWLLAAQVIAGNVSIAGWCRASYDAILPDQYGLEVEWQRSPLIAAIGYSSYWGFVFSTGVTQEKFSVSASGHWNPDRSAAATASASWNAGDGVKIDFSGSYAIYPIKTYRFSVEMKLPLIPSAMQK